MYITTEILYLGLTPLTLETYYLPFEEVTTNLAEVQCIASCKHWDDAGLRGLVVEDGNLGGFWRSELLSLGGIPFGGKEWKGEEP